MQTELHRHLDVSGRLTTLLELAQARGLEGQSTSLEAFRQKVVLHEPVVDLRALLASFVIFQKVLDRPEVLERIAFEVLEDCRNEGTTEVELRFCPSFVAEFNSLSWNDILDGFSNGLKKGLAKYPEMKAGLICIASRDYGPEGVQKTAEFFLDHQDSFIGFDLAGNEDHFPGYLFESTFKELRKANAKITVHAGEGCGPERVWESIDLLGAQRIGHGVASIQDPRLMKYLAEKQICLEMCPTSNWLCKITPQVADHPLPRFLRAGVPVTINTDDPTIVGTTLDREIALCRSEMKMSEEEIQKCQENARRASFLN